MDQGPLKIWTDSFAVVVGGRLVGRDGIPDVGLVHSLAKAADLLD